jgi:hypothetical protein
LGRWIRAGRAPPPNPGFFVVDRSSFAGLMT